MNEVDTILKCWKRIYIDLFSNIFEGIIPSFDRLFSCLLALPEFFALIFLLT